MPLQSTSQDYKEYLMKNRGIDSTQFNLDDDGNVVPRTIEQPVLNDSEKPIIDPSNLPNAKPQTTVGGTLVHGALNSALPTAAGLGVAGLTSLALAPETGGLSLLGLLGTGIAGAVGGGATSAVQDKLMPDSFKQQLAQEATDNPVSSFVGRNIPQALAFNPLTGAKNLAQAISTGGKSVAPDFAKSVISNMGISGGIDAAQQLVSGQPFSVGQLGESVGTAALFNQPNALGRKLMFEPSHQPVQGEPAIPKTVEQIMEEGSIPSGEHTTTPHEGNLMPETLEGKGDIRAAFKDTGEVKPENNLDVPDEEQQRLLADIGNLNEKDTLNKRGRPGKIGGTQLREYADEPFKSNVKTEEPLVDTGDIAKAFEPTDQTGILTAKQAELQEAHDKLVAEQKKTNEAVNELKKANVEKVDLLNDQANNLDRFNDKKIEGDYDPNVKYQDEKTSSPVTHEGFGGNPVKLGDTVKVRDKNFGRSGSHSATIDSIDKNGFADITITKAPKDSNWKAGQKVGKVFTGLLESNNSTKYQDEPVQQPIAKTKEESAFLYRNATPQYKKAVQQLMVKRGISLHEAVNLINPTTGKEALGKSSVANREVTLNPNIAETDTPIHEVSHQFLDDLSKSSDLTDQKLARDAQAIFKGHKKGAEEGTAIDQGLRGANRLATSLDGTPIERARGWAKDFMSRWKYNLNLHSDEDVSRHLSQRIQTDAPSFGYEGTKVAPVIDYHKEINKVAESAKQKDLVTNGRLYTDRQEPNVEGATRMKNRLLEKASEGPIKDRINEVDPSNVEHWKSLESDFTKMHSDRINDLDSKDKQHQASLMEYAQLINEYKNTPNGPERNAIHQQMEDIKNRNGGMPPSSKYQDESAYTKNEETKDIDKAFKFAQRFEKHPNFILDEEKGLLHPFPSKFENMLRRDYAGYDSTYSQKENEKRGGKLLYTTGKYPESELRDNLQEKIDQGIKVTNGEELRKQIQSKLGNYGDDLIASRWPDDFSAQDFHDYVKGSKNKYQDEPALSNQDKSLGITRSALDDIMKKDGPEAKPIVDAISRYYPKRDEIRARYSKPVYDAAKGMSEDSQNRVEQALLDARTSNGSQVDTLTNEKEKNLYKVMRDTLDLIPKDRNESNMPVRAFNDKGESYLRQAKSDPNYMYNQMSPKVIEALSANRNSEESKGYKKAFLDHQAAYGTKPEQAKAMWDSMTKAYASGSSNQDHFRGLDIEQGAGLPSELMRPGLLRNFDRYIGRVASARAFHDTIESNNEVASKLGYKTTPWDKPLPPSDFHSPRVNEVLKHIKGEQFDPEEAKVKGWNRVATSLMLGPLTNIHIAASSLANSLSYFRPSEIAGAVTHMITGFHTGVQHALENGSLTQKRQIFSDLVNAHSTSLEKLNGLADGISRLNGRSATEYITKGILQSAGEHLVRTRIPLAQAGDEGAIRLMKHIDPDFSPTKKYDEKEVARLASNFSGLLHGKHDARTMPAWMLHETALQPFFSLASWSIGQTNTFMKHVVTPAINEHNYTPLLMSTLGAGLGGYVIKELREGLSNKKSPIPSFNEIANSPRGVSGNLPLVGYNLAAMASFAGYAGILSTGVKTLFDGAYKNAPQGATFPLDEVAGNVVHVANNAYAAMMNTSDPKEYVKIGTKAIADILRENIQTARIASSWGDEAGVLGSDRQYKKKLNVEEDQLRRYKTTAGLPITDESSAGSDNPYYQENRKAFKHTLDLKEAAKQVPELIKQAMDEATIDGHLNPEILREKLKALKGSSYPSMPNPDNAPLQFYNYLNFLKKSRGDSYAQQHLIEYMKNNAIGKARSSLIPSI